MANKFLRVVVVAVAFLILTIAAWAMPEAFKSFLQDNSPTKVCVEFKNSCGDEKIEVNKLKVMLEDAFAARKSHKFVISETPAGADLVLKCDIVEYVWQESDPVDQVWGVASAATDAASSDNYARMQVRAELIDVKHGRAIWSDKVQANVTKTPMPKEASYEPVYKRFVKHFMVSLFKKRT